MAAFASLGSRATMFADRGLIGSFTEKDPNRGAEKMVRPNAYNPQTVGASPPPSSLHHQDIDNLPLIATANARNMNGEAENGCCTLAR